MTTSLPSRILKRPDESGTYQVETYTPPREYTIKEEGGQVRPTFPLYNKEGERKGDFHFIAPIEPEPLEPKKKKNINPKDSEDLEEREQAMEAEALRKIQKEREQILEEARESAKRILEEAETLAAQEKEEARQVGLREGYEEGYQDGRHKGEAECHRELQETLAALKEDMRQALRSVDIAKENCLKTYLEELKDCAIAIGEKVIHISLKSSGEVIKKMIVSATEKLKKTAWVKIYIDKCDYDMMMESDADILDELSHLSDNIKFIVMDKEEQGNCIIEMPEEIVDVSVNTQIENIKDILENVRV
ncbi:MAG: flagellar biosynthesis/type III secretory pathway protein [Lachnospiraceae bacterium]|nr:flagellar biosynthesis/type III secretory pathway protein [Lachnospiraceae bacterium]